jgi:hypothetical protein
MEMQCYQCNRVNCQNNNIQNLHKHVLTEQQTVLITLKNNRLDYGVSLDWTILMA